jgi:hypothetical protein
VLNQAERCFIDYRWTILLCYLRQVNTIQVTTTRFLWHCHTRRIVKWWWISYKWISEWLLIFIKRIRSKSQVHKVLCFVWPQQGTAHQSPSGTEVNKKWSYTSAPPLYLHGMLWGNLYLLQYHRPNMNFRCCPLLSLLHKLVVFPPSGEKDDLSFLTKLISTARPYIMSKHHIQKWGLEITLYTVQPATSGWVYRTSGVQNI